MGPTERRIMNVFVPKFLNRQDPIRRIIVQLDDGSYLDSDQVEISAKVDKANNTSEVRLTLKSTVNIQFYSPDEVDW